MQQGRAMTGQELGIGMQARPVAIQVALVLELCLQAGPRPEALLLRRITFLLLLLIIPIQST
ncbi:hypothetical protein Pint_11559 [Pistacia integerrima]|uniref:Uncharacterized protein n=1 Tax=Pistacia integerrima TaxID=434235 RepID=A0ACC0XKL1_9ROSI|nr:hypothetical protein Pint_11559 [Pistacia integerrima]